jgi:ribosome biogenesis protein BRX1
MLCSIWLYPRNMAFSQIIVVFLFCFDFLKTQIWVRHYQIVEQKAENASEAHRLKKQLGVNESTSLVEIGPRFVLEPIKVFRGSFGGQTLYNNTKFTSPNAVRALAKKQAGDTFAHRQATQQIRKERDASIIVPTDPLDSVFKK